MSDTEPGPPERAADAGRASDGSPTGGSGGSGGSDGGGGERSRPNRRRSRRRRSRHRRAPGTAAEHPAAAAATPDAADAADTADRSGGDGPSPGDAGSGPGADGGAGPSRSKRRRRGRRRRPSSAAAGAASETKEQVSEEAKAPTKETDGAHPEEATSAGASLRAAVLRHTSAAVLRRGKGYVAQRRVAGLRIGAGEVRARVRGSNRQPYRVVLRAAGGSVPVKKLRWSCNCPYAADHRRTTCKHVVAAALVAAERLEQPEWLARWLGQVSAEQVVSPAVLDAIAQRLLESFSQEPATAASALNRADAIVPAPFDVEAASA